MVDPGSTLGLDAKTIFGSRELISQTQTVGAMGINMHLHRDSLVVESLIKEQGIFHRYAVILRGMPQESGRRVRIYLIFQGHFIHQLVSQ